MKLEKKNKVFDIKKRNVAVKQLFNCEIMNFSIEKIKKKKNINIQVEHCQAIVKQDSEKSKLVKSYNSFKLNHLKTYLWIQTKNSLRI